MKKFLLFFLLAITGGVLWINVATLRNEEQEINTQQQGEYYVFFPSDLKGSGIGDYSSLSATGNKLPRYYGSTNSESGNASSDVLYSGEATSLSRFSYSTKTSGPSTSQDHTETTNSLYSVNKDKTKFGGSGGGVSGSGMAIAAVGGTSSSSVVSGSQGLSHIALANRNSDLFADEVGVLADGDVGNADPGRYPQIIQAIPVPAGIFVLLFAALFYSIRLSLLNKKKATSAK